MRHASSTPLLVAMLLAAAALAPARVHAGPGTVWARTPQAALPVGTPFALSTAGGTTMKLTVTTGGTQGVGGGQLDTTGVAETALAYDSLWCIGIFNGGGSYGVPTTLAFTQIHAGPAHRRGLLMVGAVNGASSPVTVSSSIPGRVATWTVVGHPFDIGPTNTVDVSWNAASGTISTSAGIGNDSRGIVLDLGDLASDGDVTISLNQNLNDGIDYALGEELTGTLAVPPATPPALTLSAPRPNPAHGEVALAFTLPAAGSARLAVFDVTGRRLATLAEGTFGAGTQAVRWDLRDAAGVTMPAGLAFVRLETSAGTRVARLIVVR